MGNSNKYNPVDTDESFLMESPPKDIIIREINIKYINKYENYINLFDRYLQEYYFLKQKMNLHQNELNLYNNIESNSQLEKINKNLNNYFFSMNASEIRERRIFEELEHFLDNNPCYNQNTHELLKEYYKIKNLRRSNKVTELIKMYLMEDFIRLMTNYWKN